MGQASITYIKFRAKADGTAALDFGYAVLNFDGDSPKAFKAFTNKLAREGFVDHSDRTGKGKEKQTRIMPGAILKVKEQGL